jgi:hypothetical protein
VGVPVLIVTGPVGVGKTTVAHEVGRLLRPSGVPYAVIDIDALAGSYPPPPGDGFNAQMAFRNLASVWRNYAEAGVQRLILAYVFETRQELEMVRQAVPGAELTVVRLHASHDELRERVAGRERGSSREWHLHRAVELAELMDRERVEDHLVHTDGRDVLEVAHAVAEQAGWI